MKTSTATIIPLLGCTCLFALPAAPALAGENWNVLLGAGALHQPDYEGSDEHRTRGSPYLEISYRDLFVLAGDTVQLNLLALRDWRANGVRAGITAHALRDRDEDDNPALRGLGNLDAGLATGLFASYAVESWTFSTSATTDVTGAQGGWVAELATRYERAITGRVFVQLGASVSWADERYLQRVFGVSADQSMRSGMTQHRASAGLTEVASSATLGWILDRHWSVLAIVELSELQDSAAASPIVQQHGSARQWTVATGVGYRF
jgi:outer membrane scaffolding protein for murein synthesis (MipA/OmpV family)